MNKKTIILITAILSFSLGQSLKLPSIASTDLQSTGRIIVNNPDTGNQEIIFDATDQEKLKNNITANASEILDLKEWQEQQLEINQEFSDKDTELEDDISGLQDKDIEHDEEIATINDRLDIDTKLIDGIPHWSERGADTWYPFRLTSAGSNYLFYYGDINSEMSGGLRARCIKDTSYVEIKQSTPYEKGYMKLVAGFRSGYYISNEWVYTVNKVNLSGYDTLNINVTSYGGHLTAFYSTTEPTTAASGGNIPTGATLIGDLDEGENAFDISNIDDGYIGVFQNSYDTDGRYSIIDKIWFE